MNLCKICRAETAFPLIDLGPQPLTNRYPASAAEPVRTFPMTMLQCGACGTVQLEDPVPAEILRPEVDWIFYREQEAHLDQLVETACGLAAGPPEERLVRGVTFKDESTVARFAAKGFRDGSFLRLDADFGCDDSRAGLETAQALLTRDWALGYVAEKGAADVLVARHVIEHAHDIHEFAGAAAALLAPGGVVVFEAPDCGRGLTLGDHTLPWEEHVFYFTPETFRATLAGLGFEILEFHCFEYPTENSLTAVCRWLGAAAPGAVEPGPLERQLDLGRGFGAALESRKAAAREELAGLKAAGETVALFGAGHLSATFVSLLELGGLIDFVVDDHPKKQGLLLPGTNLPIVGSSALLDRGAAVCLLSLSPDSEARVRENNREFLDRAGRFLSIFPGRDNSI